jgi:transcriptional regulator
MYRPNHFKVDDPKLLAEFIQEYPLAVVICNSEEGLKINYLPFLFDSEGKEPVLLGHMARANPQLKNLENSFATIAFQGPDRYISPTWYAGNSEVPTWNYAAVEVRGRIELLQTFEEIEDILTKSTEQFEQKNETNWNYALPLKQREGMVRHIVGIKIHIESIEGKFKLNQNRDKISRDQVMANLNKSSSSTDKKMLYWMEKAQS